MEPISSFGISLGAGIALELIKTASFPANVEKEINIAFNRALKKWSKNWFIRGLKKRALKNHFKVVISQPLKHDSHHEFVSFYDLFEQELAKQQFAYNYLKEIRDEKRFVTLLEKLNSLEIGLGDVQNTLSTIKADISQIPIREVLKSEWKDQIELFKRSLEDFMPNTALVYIKELEKRIHTSGCTVDKGLLGAIDFLKASCHELLGRGNEAYELFLKAYNHIPTNPDYQCKACISLYKTGELTKAKNLSEEILIKDLFNPLGWAITALLEKNSDTIDTLLQNVPRLVGEKAEFKRIIFFNTYLDGFADESNRVYEEYSYYPDFTKAEVFPTTYYNFKEKLFLIEITIFKLLNKAYIDFNNRKALHSEVVIYLSHLLREFWGKIENKEIEEQFKIIKFFLYYTDFIILGEKDIAVKMKFASDELKSHSFYDQILLFTANCLQLAANNEDAIELINKQKEKSLEAIYLESFCNLKMDKIQEFSNNAIEFINLLDTIDVSSCENLLFFPTVLFEKNEVLPNSVINAILTKKYEQESIKILVGEYLKVTMEENCNLDIVALGGIEDELLNTPLIFYVTHSYFLAGKYRLAIDVFRKYVDKEKPSQHLYYYILALFYEGSENAELLELLQKWRRESPIDKLLLKFELKLQNDLLEWKECISICEYYRKKFNWDEYFLPAYINSLDHIGSAECIERIVCLIPEIKKLNCQNFQSIAAICNVLIENQLFSEALDISFEYAFDKENIQARTYFFYLMGELPAESSINKEEDLVSSGCFVELSGLENNRFIQITDQNPFALNLIGKRKGDIVILNEPITNIPKSVEIKRIINKYTFLVREIIQDASDNPFLGYPMRSVSFNDATPEAIKEKLFEVLGPQELHNKDFKEKNLKEYFSYNLSFSELILNNYEADFIGGYFDLICNKGGFLIIPEDLYQPLPELNGKQIYIDFSTLPLIFNVFKETISPKFSLSKGIYEYLKFQLKKEKRHKGPKIGLDFSYEGVKVNALPIEVIESNIKLFEEILNWIESNCVLISPPGKLDLFNKIKNQTNVKQDDFFWDNLFSYIAILIHEKDSVLITDDSIYQKFFPLQIKKFVSSEVFLSQTLTEDQSWKETLVTHKYVGIQISEKQLIDHYKRSLAGQNISFYHCLKNLALGLYPNERKVRALIQFLKEASLDPAITNERLSVLARSSFVILLKGYPEPTYLKLTKRMIIEELKLLGDRLEIVNKAFHDAVSIIRISV